MPSLSLTMIVRNEAHHIQRVLKHAMIFADEIVVVDTGSSDETPRLARQHGAAVFDFPWCDDFAAARNFGISNCRMDYVIWLDADDVVSLDSATAIKSMMGSSVDWEVLYLPYEYAKNSDGRTETVQWRERIFRRRPEFEFEFPVHECLKIPNGTRKQRSKTATIVHDSLSRHESSNERNLRILRSAVESEAYRNSFRMWWLLAQEEPLERSLPIFEKVLTEFTECDSFSPTLRGQVLFQYAERLLHSKRFSAALEAFGTAAALCPSWREPFFGAGRTLWMQQRFREALSMFCLCGHIQIPQEDFEIQFNPEIYDGEEFLQWMYIAHHALGNEQEMNSLIQKGRQQFPNSEWFRRRDISGLKSVPIDE